MQSRKIKLLLPFISIIVTIFACTNNSPQDVVLEVNELKNEIDTVLINIIHPKQNDLRQQIVTANTEGKDTFGFARDMVTLKKLDFLLNNRHDQLSESLRRYEAHEIEREALYEELEGHRSYLDSLTTTYNLDTRQNEVIKENQ